MEIKHRQMFKRRNKNTDPVNRMRASSWIEEQQQNFGGQYCTILTSPLISGIP
jgi:hypothetical protein